jgi:hypothetical protein
MTVFPLRAGIETGTIAGDWSLDLTLVRGISHASRTFKAVGGVRLSEDFLRRIDKTLVALYA